MHSGATSYNAQWINIIQCTVGQHNAMHSWATSYNAHCTEVQHHTMHNGLTRNKKGGKDPTICFILNIDNYVAHLYKV